MKTLIAFFALSATALCQSPLPSASPVVTKAEVLARFQAQLAAQRAAVDAARASARIQAERSAEIEHSTTRPIPNTMLIRGMFLKLYADGVLLQAWHWAGENDAGTYGEIKMLGADGRLVDYGQQRPAPPTVESLVFLKGYPLKDSLVNGDKIKVIAVPTGEVFSADNVRAKVFTMNLSARADAAQ